MMSEWSPVLSMRALSPSPRTGDRQVVRIRLMEDDDKDGLELLRVYRHHHVRFGIGHNSSRLTSNTSNTSINHHKFPGRTSYRLANHNTSHRGSDRTSYR